MSDLHYEALVHTQPVVQGASPLPLLGLSAILGMNAAPVNGAPFQIVDFLQNFSRALDLPGFSSLQRNGDHGCRKHNYSLTILLKKYRLKSNKMFSLKSFKSH